MNDSNYADVNGLHLYYEMHGANDLGSAPLVLLHGGFGTTQMFADLLPELAKSRQVIAVELQAHGRTADIDRPMRFETLADDVAALLKHLNITRADVLGYSMGAGVALQLATRHPQLVGKLIVVSFPFKSAGFFSDIVRQQKQISAEAAEGMKQTPMYQRYVQVAQKPQDWPKLVGRMGELMGQDFNWTHEVKNLQATVMLVGGDADMLPPAHLAEFFALLGAGQQDGCFDHSGMTRHRLAILPATTHYELLQAPTLLALVQDFLSKA